MFDEDLGRELAGSRAVTSAEMTAATGALGLDWLMTTMQLGGEAAAFAITLGAIGTLGAGVRLSSALSSALVSGASPAALEALRSGDLGEFLLRTGIGAISGAAAAQLGRYASMLGAVEGAAARGALVGALGGVVSDLAAGEDGVTLQSVILGAAAGAIAGRLGSRFGAGGAASVGGEASAAGPRRVSGRLGTAGGVRAEGEAAKIARYLEQGYSPQAAAELAKQYAGVGHHFVHRGYVTELIERYGADSLRGKFLKAFRDSPWNVKKPTWMTKGEFYEWHARLHGAGGEAAFGRRTAQGARLLPGEAWQSAKVVEGLESYGKLGYLWQGSPTRPKVAAGGAAVGVGAGGYAVWDAVTPDGSSGK